jgi:hypothetical protein
MVLPLLQEQSQLMASRNELYRCRCKSTNEWLLKPAKKLSNTFNHSPSQTFDQSFEVPRGKQVLVARPF